jgi:hypothetical protein
MGQIRQFSLTEKIKVQSTRFQNYPYPLTKSRSNLANPFAVSTNNWVSVNQPKDEKFLKLKSKKLVIYPYSLSSNLLKEVLLKMGLKFVLTNEIQKASLIIGLKKHLKQNFKLITLAKQKNIPIYTVNQVNFYQVSKLIQFLCS